jgi:hypothetical protein
MENIMATKSFLVKFKRKGQTFGSSTTSYSAKDIAEVKKKFQKEHPDCQIIEVKQK